MTDERSSYLLDEEQRAALRRLLSRTEAAPPRQALDKLVAAVQASMTAFSKQYALKASFRTMHDELRVLSKLMTAADPSIGLIRRRLLALHPASAAVVEGRARRLWPSLFRCDMPSAGLMAWSQTAPALDFLQLWRAAIVEGGVMVPGRRRRGGHRSRARFEPLILGIARGLRRPRDASDGTTDANDAPRRRPIIADGRRRDDLTVQLIAFLAVDWALATAAMPQAGRSDRTLFGDLVHQVFGWLDLPNAAGALRRYWQAYGSLPAART